MSYKGFGRVACLQPTRMIKSDLIRDRTIVISYYSSEMVKWSAWQHSQDQDTDSFHRCQSPYLGCVAKQSTCASTRKSPKPFQRHKVSIRRVSEWIEFLNEKSLWDGEFSYHVWLSMICNCKKIFRNTATLHTIHVNDLHSETGNFSFHSQKSRRYI